MKPTRGVYNFPLVLVILGIGLMISSARMSLPASSAFFLSGMVTCLLAASVYSMASTLAQHAARLDELERGTGDRRQEP